MRYREAFADGRKDALRRVRARAGDEMFVDDLFRSFLAAATATADGQTTLHLEERAGTTIHAFADLAIGHGMANTDVHAGWQEPLVVGLS